MARHLQQSFNSGELAPALHARTDLARYASGVKLMRNFVPTTTGGARNRPGTVFLGYTYSQRTARLFPFSYSTDQTYVIEATDGGFRWYSNGKRVSLLSTSATLTNGGFSSLTGWTDISSGGGSILAAGIETKLTSGTPVGDMDDGPGMDNAFNSIEDQDASECPEKENSLSAWIGKDWGSGVTKTVSRFRLVAPRTQGFKTGGSPSLTIRLEGSNDAFASVARLYETTITDSGGRTVDRREGIVTTTAYRYHRVWITGGDEDEDTNVAELSFYETGTAGRVNLVGNGTGVAAIQQAVACASNLAQEHQIRFRVIDNRCFVRVGKTSGGQEVLADRECLPGWHSVSFTPGQSPFYLQFRNTDASTAGVAEVAIIGSNSPSATSAIEIFTPYREDQLWAINYTQSADVITLVHPEHPPRELRRYGPYAWSLVDISFGPSQPAPVAGDWSISVEGDDPVGTSNTYKYKITYETESGEESLPSAEKTETADALGENRYIEFDIDHPYPDGVKKANVYKYKAGKFGFIGSTEDGYFEDKGIAAEVDITPPSSRNPFTGADNYPSAVGYWEQRQWLGGTNAAPDTIESSQTGAYRNFTKSEPLQDSDAITLTPASREVNRIRHLLGGSGLWVLTSGAVWRVERGEQGVTPANEGGIKKLYPYGASLSPPLEVGKSVLFVQEHGRAVRDLVVDAVSEAFSEELSKLAAHLLHGRRITDWCWQSDPFGVVWMVRDDGVLLSMTYDRQQEVLGWARHDTAGEYVSVACVSEPEGDAVYAVVRRYLQGAYRHMVERFSTRIITDVADGHFVDGGQYQNEPKPILELTLDPFAVKAAGSGALAGDYIDFADMGAAYVWRGSEKVLQIASYLEGKRFLVDSVSGDTLNLADRHTGEAVDTSDWPAWLEGGVIRRAVSTVGKLEHLEGEEVAILADGSVVASQTVSGGEIELATPASRVHVGLPYTSDLQTLPIPLAAEYFNRRKRITHVNFWLEFSRGVQGGPDENNLQDIKWRTSEAWDQTTRPKTGYLENPVRAQWSDDGVVFVRQAEPLPLELLGLEREFEVGETEKRR